MLLFGMKKIGQNDNASYLLEYLNILMKKTERRGKKSQISGTLFTWHDWASQLTSGKKGRKLPCGPKLCLICTNNSYWLKMNSNSNSIITNSPHTGHFLPKKFHDFVQALYLYLFSPNHNPVATTDLEYFQCSPSLLSSSSAILHTLQKLMPWI